MLKSKCTIQEIDDHWVLEVGHFKIVFQGGEVAKHLASVHKAAGYEVEVISKNGKATYQPQQKTREL